MVENAQGLAVKALPTLDSGAASHASASQTAPRDYMSLVSLNAELSDRLAERDGELAAARQRVLDLETSWNDALNEAVEAAREEERDKSNARNDEKLERIKDALAAGQARFESFLSDSDALALELLSASFTSLLGDPSRPPEILTRAIKQAIGEIGSTSILNIRVSASDFGADGQALDLPEDLVQTGLRFEDDPALLPGESVFELLIGTYELSLPEHWMQLREIIESTLEKSRSESEASS